MIDNKTKEMVWTLHEIDKRPKTDIAKQLGISRQKVYDILKDDSYKNRHLNDAVKKIHQEQTESLINVLSKDSRLPDTVNKILNAVNKDEVINKMVQMGDLRQLMGVVKVLSDTHIGSKKVYQDERRIKIQERMAELKERELDMRITNPESFQAVQIINDAPNDNFIKIKDNEYTTNTN